jgi:hypothetical protein
MNEMTTFEHALAERLRADAVRRTRPFDPADIAATARQGAVRRQFGLPLSMRLVLLALITALLVLALSATLFFLGQRRTSDDPTAPTPAPTLAVAPAPTPAPTLAVAPAPTSIAPRTAHPRTTLVALIAGSPAPGETCPRESGARSTEYGYLSVRALDGCIQVASGTRFDLDVLPASSAFAPDLVFGGGYLQRWTQAYMTVLNGTSSDACPSEMGPTGYWPDSIRLDQLGSNRLCVLTNGGSLVELRVDPFYQGRGRLTIHYRTIEEASK